MALGGILIAIGIGLVFPVLVLISGGIASGLLGWVLKQDADDHGDDVWRRLNY
jgi:ABC-type thiamin/hydroxymethylpyrimidine transport system permease subunit